MLRNKFLPLDYKGVKYILFSGDYQMEFCTLEDAETYREWYRIKGDIVKYGR